MDVLHMFQAWFFHLIHAAVTFMISVCSYWTSFASKFQFQNVTKQLDLLPTGYYTLPTADELYFSGMKTPLHLGLLVLEDTYCLASIALVISLAYSIGIRHFSVYTKDMTHGEYLDLEKKISAWMSSNANSKTAQVNIHHILSPPLRAHDKDTLNVNIVHPPDGRQMIVDVTKHIAQLIKSGAISSNDVSPEYVDKLLQGRLKCPDPDLVLKFGAVPSTGGYLPWQMRLTEIISIPSLRKFTPRMFRRSLMSFSKIEQRFGK